MRPPAALAFTDVDLNDTHSVTTHSLASAVWSGGTVPTDTQTAVAAAFDASVATDSTNTGAGSLAWSFSLADHFADFLREGETLTLTYDVIVTDNSGGAVAASDVKQVTVTITGTNDQPVITAGDSANLTEDASQTGLDTPALATSGTLAFTDVDLNDTHSVTTHSLASAVWSGGTVPTDTQTAVAAAFDASVATDSTNTGAGSLAWSFSLADHFADFLREGETLTLTYDVIVTDNSGGAVPASDVKQVTVTITGTNDQPVITAGDSANLTEDASQTGLDTPALATSGTLAFTDVDLNDTHSVTTHSLASAVWSGGTVPTDTQTAVAAAFDASVATDSTNTGAGSLAWSFSLADHFADFLREGETLTLTYDVIVTDNSGGAVPASDVKQVTVTITGTNDQPVITAGDSANLTEDASQTGLDTPALATSGTLAFTDVDLNDTHSVTTHSLASAVWSGGTVPTDTQTAVAAAFDASVATDSTNTGAGSLAWSFSLADHFADFLREGETLTLTYDVIVTDNSGGAVPASDVKQVTVTITGSNDQPVITAGDSANLTEDASQTGLDTPALATSGTLAFTDVDLNDTHSVTTHSLASAVWSGGTVPTDTQTAVAAAFDASVATDSTNTGAGSLAWSFSLADHFADFLREGETLTLTYDVIVTDNSGGAVPASDVKQVTVTITGTNDQPVITAGDSANLTEDASQTGLDTPALATSGTLAFTDVDLNDTHSVTTHSLASAVWSGGTVPTDTQTAVAAAFDASVATDSTNTGAGSLAWSFSLADHFADFLREGETLTLTYDVIVTDNSGGAVPASDVKQVTVTITGSNDQPVITAGDSANLTEDASQTGLDTPALATSGTLAFTDVDLNDTHSVTTHSLASAVWSGGTVPTDTQTAVAAAFDASVATDSTNTGAGSLAWSFSLADHFADFLREGETLTLTYDVIVTDNSGGAVPASDVKQVTVTITGTNDQPVITAGDSANLTEDASQTGLDTPALATSGTLAFTDVDLNDTHSVTTHSLASAVWSGGTVPTDTQTAVAAAFDASVATDSTNTGAGSLAWSFSLADHFADFLREGETLTLTYDVVVTDNSGGAVPASDVKQVTVTITGSNDTPTITVVDAVGAVTEDVGTVPDNPNTTTVETGSFLADNGSVTFADVDLNDHENASVALTGSSTTSTAGISTALASALADALVLPTSHFDSNTGTIDWSFALDNSLVQYLAKDETVTATYTITLTDDSGDSATNSTTQTVNVTVTGTNDAPIITSSAVTDALQEDGDGSRRSRALSGTLAATDADHNAVLTWSVANSGAVIGHDADYSFAIDNLTIVKDAATIVNDDMSSAPANGDDYAVGVNGTPGVLTSGHRRQFANGDFPGRQHRPAVDVVQHRRCDRRQQRHPADRYRRHRRHAHEGKRLRCHRQVRPDRAQRYRRVLWHPPDRPAAGSARRRHHGQRHGRVAGGGGL